MGIVGEDSGKISFSEWELHIYIKPKLYIGMSDVIMSEISKAV